MKIFILLLVVGLVLGKAGSCTQAYCKAQVDACRTANCDGHVASCANQFRNAVGRAQRDKTFQGTKNAEDDFNYCMSTKPEAKQLRACQKQYCSKVLIQEELDLPDTLTGQ